MLEGFLEGERERPSNFTHGGLEDMHFIWSFNYIPKCLPYRNLYKDRQSSVFLNSPKLETAHVSDNNGMDKLLIHPYSGIYYGAEK